MNTERMTIIASYPAPGLAPRGLAWDGESLWHVDEQLQRLFKLDSQDLHVILSFPISGEPRGLEWDGRHLWLTDNCTKMIQQIEPASGRVCNSLTIPDAGYLVGLAFHGQTLWQGHYDGRVTEIDGATQRVVNRQQVGHAICGMTWAQETLWYVDDELPALHLLDPSTWMEGTRFGLRGDAAGLTWDGHHFWYADARRRTIQQLAFPPQHFLRTHYS